VLVHSITAHRQAWNAALHEKNLPPLDPQSYSSMLGRTSQAILNGYLELQHMPMPLDLQIELLGSKEQFLRKFVRKGVQTTPGVINWLEFFKAKQIPCAVASSGEMGNIVAVLEFLDLSDYFASILSGARLEVSKPDPTIFLLAAASLGVHPVHCMVIEDAPAGIQAAKSAQMLCCALATTLPREELRQADLVLNNLSQVEPEALFSN
jgi:HAD superfamily hydrolase (TIGR01509 family)